jgi:uncharacterized peroxidase-related enzyme
MPHIALRNDLVGITSLLDYRKEAAKPLCVLTNLLLRGESTLTEAERELIAAHVSYLNECRFCSTAHAAVSCASRGGDKSMVDAIRNGEDTPVLSAKMKALLQVAGKVQRGGKSVKQEDIKHAVDNGATDKEIHDTVLIAALFCLYNRYVDGLATVAPADPAYYATLADRITSRGYKMPEDGYKPLIFK